MTPYYPNFVTSPNTGEDKFDGKDFSTFVRVCRKTIWYRVHMLMTVQRSCPEMDKVIRNMMETAHEITHLFIISEDTSMYWEKDPCQMIESERLVAVEQLKQEYGNNWNKWKNQ